MHSYTLGDESRSQSEDSPGLVRNEETLLRAMFHPEHIREGKVIEAAIPLNDLRSRGFSVDRRDFAQCAALHAIIAGLMTRHPDLRQVSMVAHFLCESVRQFGDSQEIRAFLVIDTACPTHVSHASIYAAHPGPDSNLRKLRSLLLPLLQCRVPLSEIFAK
jgi:hypothetical protein